MNVANVWLIFSIKSLTFLPDLHPGESWFDSLTTRSPCWHCSYEFVRCGIHTESVASLLVATIPDQKTHSSRLVSSGGLLKGIQTPLRKVSCFMQFTWSVRLNSLLRTAGRPSPSSNNPPQRATHVGKTPSSTQGPFLSNNPSTRPAWIRVLARNGVSDPTPQETRVITSFQLSHRENVKLSQAQERHYCIRNTDSHFHIALLTLKFDTKTSWSHPCQYPEKKIPLKPLQHLVFIDPHVPPPCWALWLARP